MPANSVIWKRVCTNAWLVVMLAAPGLLAGQKWNVLLIAVDDLRPALGCYGDPVALTPHIDRLAERGLVCKRAYCQQAVCSPSRLSLLTGLRPDEIGVWDLKTHFRAAVPDAVTLPQYFKGHGYFTQSIGKVFHGSGKPSRDPRSWTVAPQFDYVRDPKLRYATLANLQGEGLKRAATEAAAVDEKAYVDGLVCQAAIEALAMFDKQKPFFLAVGFRKPHLPFCAPQKYWDLYRAAEIPLPRHATHPSRAPEWAVRSWMELEGYTDIPRNGAIGIEKIRELRHGYYACVSYVDALVGRLLKALEQQRIADSTVVMLWGDHGYHLGEQGLWTKANNFELSTRVPLIVSSPQHDGKVETSALVELVDVYPTMVELCGLPPQPHLSGKSFVPLFVKPLQPWKRAAISQYPRARRGHRHQGAGDLMGYALRTDRFRYVEWMEWQSKQVLARELYDHTSDQWEMNNVADDAHYVGDVRRLSSVLSEHLSGQSTP